MNVEGNELRGLIREVVHETLLALGADASEPLELQRDLAHLRALRIGRESTRAKVYGVVIGVMVTGALAALWQGLKAVLPSL